MIRRSLIPLDTQTFLGNVTVQADSFAIFIPNSWHCLIPSASGFHRTFNISGYTGHQARSRISFIMETDSPLQP